jgi:hypothetical protein
MAKKAKAKEIQEALEQEIPTMIDPFVGGEEDDLMDMEYTQNDRTSSQDTHPPETKEEAEAIAEAAEEAAKKLAEATAENEVVEDETVVDELNPEPEAVVAEPNPDDKTVVEEPEGVDLKVPKDRFDEVNERMKAAEEKAERLEQQLETVVEEPEPEPELFDYKAKEEEAMDALLEGDKEKYSALNAEIRVAEKAEYLREAKKVADQGDSRVQENLGFEEAGAKIEEDFPQFSQKSESFNEEARTEMLDLYVGYARSGTYTRVESLQRAAAQAARIYGYTASSVVVPDVPDNVVAIKPTDVPAKIAAAAKQPPNMEGRAPGSMEEPRVDINSMSDEEFDGLPESTKQRMRGDVV